VNEVCTTDLVSRKRLIANLDWRLEMKLTKTFLSTFLLLLVSLHATAQEGAGKFILAHEARWGTAILPAGSYFASVHSVPVPYVLVTSLDHNHVSIMAVANYIESAGCKTSSLELQQEMGTWNVHSLCIESSLAAYFKIPGEKLNQQRPAQIAALATSH